MAMTLTRHELDGMTCAVPGCTCGGDVLVLVPRCHPMSATVVRYDRKTGDLRVACKKCDAPVAAIAVADNPEIARPCLYTDAAGATRCRECGSRARELP